MMTLEILEANDIMRTRTEMHIMHDDELIDMARRVIEKIKHDFPHNTEEQNLQVIAQMFIVGQRHRLKAELRASKLERKNGYLALSLEKYLLPTGIPKNYEG